MRHGIHRGDVETSMMLAADPLPLARGAKWTYDVRLKKLDLEYVAANPGSTFEGLPVRMMPSNLANRHAMSHCEPLAGIRTAIPPTTWSTART